MKQYIIYIDLILIIMLLPVTVFPQGPGAEWSYKQSISISPVTPSSNFQIHVELTASNFDYSNANINGDDIRFYDNLDNSLSYWIESWNAAGNSVIWVKVAQQGTGSIDMYYGNPDAPALSNGDNTFLLFDDFNSSSLNTSKWYLRSWGNDGVPSMSISNGIIKFQGAVCNGMIQIHSKATFSPPIITEAKVVNCYETGSIAQLKPDRFGVLFGINFEKRSLMNSISFTYNSLYAPWVDHVRGDKGAYTGIWQLEWLSNTYARGIMPSGTLTFDPKKDLDTNLNVAMGTHGGNSQIAGYLHADWIRVRRCSSTEPTTTPGPSYPTGPGDYYVSPAGNDSTGYGTQSNPWRTIKFAVSKAASSSRIHIAAGVYTETVGLYNKAMSFLGDNPLTTIVQAAESADLATERVFSSSSDWNVNPKTVYKNLTIRHGNSTNGAAIKQGKGSLYMENCIVCNNIADQPYYAAIYCGGQTFQSKTQKFYNCIICNNENGGISIDSGPKSYARIFNCTVANNDEHGIVIHSGSDAELINTILFNNPYLYEGSALARAYYSNIPGGYSGSGNIDSDPLFISPTSGIGNAYDGLASNWSLLYQSPCRNTGNPDTSSIGLPPYDILGNPRVVGKQIDMGAHELQYNPVIEVCGTVSSDLTWQADTVKITCPVTVQNNATLAIAPGTVIEFQGYHSLDISGRLLAIGTENDSIIFTAKDKSIGWNGIRFYSIPTETDSSIIKYSRIENGNAVGNDTPNQHGGGVYVENFSKLCISRCEITKNNAQYRGGGIYCHDASINISGNSIHDNTSSSGGGIHCYTHSNAIIQNNVICNNIGGNAGGGITCENGSITYIINNIIVNNHADKGGGVSCQANVQLTNNVICNNTALNKGGGIWIDYDATLTNSIIYGNSCVFGDQIYIEYTNNSMMKYNNIEGGLNGLGYANQAEIYDSSLYQMNIDSDPYFIQPTPSSGVIYNALSTDWSLQSNSLCINRGTPDTTGLHIGNYDVYHNPRIMFNQIDIGAVEYQQNIAYSDSAVISEPSSHEFNENGDGHTIIMNIDSINGQGIITVNQVNQPPIGAPGNSVIQLFWNLLSKDITSFSITITFHYMDEDISGIEETSASLGVAKFNESTNTWIWLDGTVDAGSNTVTVSGVTSFSTFALFRRIFGDVTGDGYVDAADLQRLGDCWHETNSGGFTSSTDARFFNYNKNTSGGNQIIDAGDLQVFGDCWHNGTP